MTVVRDLEQEVRLLFQRLVKPGGVALTDSQVIPADDAGPRPSKGFLTVRVSDLTQEGEADMIRGSDVGVATIRARTWHRGLCSVNAYGVAAADWLAEFMVKLQLPGTVEYTEGRAITLRPNGGTRNLSALLDTATEARYQQDFDVYCALTMPVADVEEAPELETVVLDDLEGDPGSYQREVTITLP